MAASVLVSIAPANVVNGTANAVLSAALGVGEGFQASRPPDFSTGAALGQAPVMLTATGPVAVPGGQQYTLQFPTPVAGEGAGGLWYVRTVVAGAANSNVLPVWLDVSLVKPYTLGGRALADAILANKPGIDLLLAAVDPALSFQAAVFGAEWNASAKTPGVLVQPFSCTETYETNPRGRIVRMQYRVTGLIRQNDASNEADGVSQLMEALKGVLNQSCYETATLADNTIVNGGMSNEHQFADDFLDNVWASRISTLWQWEYIRYTA